jgi:hypothetical protein
MNLSQPVLAIMFGMEQGMAVSDCINAVSRALELHFVPNFLGFRHMTREEAITTHGRQMFKTLFETDDDTLFVTFDGTYLYTDKPGDFDDQKHTWSEQKKRNLVKPMMVVLESGYVIDAPGPFFGKIYISLTFYIHNTYVNNIYFVHYKYTGNGANNDATILESMLVEGNDLWTFLNPEKDHVILDRGFRDIVRDLKRRKLHVHMPELKPTSQDHFSTMQANRVTLVRWLVEAINGKLKMKFKFFSDVIPGAYLPKLTRFFRIAMAILNCFFPTLIDNTPRRNEIALLALERIKLDNHLEKRVKREKLDDKTNAWTLASASVVPEFPHLSIEDMQNLTLGVYQTGLADEYVKQHLNADSEFLIEVNNEVSEILRAKLRSRFRTGKKHYLWIEFDQQLEGHNSITGHFCTCWVGSRTVGLCAHISCVCIIFTYFITCIL